MALLERVAALLRANLIDLIDRAEDPVKMMQQVVVDMENQLLQVKTQVAIAVADLHILDKKRKEHEERETEWIKKAEIAMKKGDEELAKGAVQRAVASRDTANSFREQMADQKVQVENLRTAFAELQAKLAKTRPQLELVKVQKRRDRTGMPPATPDGIEERFRAIEKQDEVERILEELRTRDSRL